MDIQKTLVFVPTYNERENVVKLCEDILALRLPLDILFVDDNSPDGTGDVLDDLSRKYANVFVLHRKGKLGIGSAHLEGIHWAHARGYPWLITMDCDFTHPPEHIPDLLREAKDYDIVVGSRYLLKDSLSGWNPYRKVLTFVGHLLTKYILKLSYDATGAFRLYRLDKIPPYAFSAVRSMGYSFFFESLYILNLNRYAIKEIPIKLPPRTYGHSKMGWSDAVHSFNLLVSVCLNTWFHRERYEVCEPFVPEHNGEPHLVDNQGWDGYWENQNSRLVYDVIATIYRKFIIRKSFNHYISAYFKKGASVLHAGCGSGQIDIDIHDKVSITALDISVNALNVYKKINKNNCRLLHGSIFSIPLPGASMDGVYNLGVMEHFDESDIKKILAEFHRVLKPGGRVIIFWPPEFGVSVMFFKTLKAVLQPFFKKELKFHPDEICRIKSKKFALDTFSEAKFNVLEYYFGIRDAFTYSVIVADKN